MSNQFLWGMLVGVAGVYVFHHFVKPLPGAKSG